MHVTLSVSALLALVASCAALQITYPAQGSSLDLSKDNKITWNSVSSDPSSFNIVLVNQNVNPPVSTNIANNVATSDGSYDLTSLSGASAGSGYQFNLVSNDPKNSGILAQTGQITITPAGASTTSASFTGTTSSLSSTSSGTSTVTTTTTSGTTLSSSASSSSSTSASGSSSKSASSSASSSAAKASATGAASSLNTFAGAGMLAMVAALFA